MQGPTHNVLLMTCNLLTSDMKLVNFTCNLLAFYLRVDINESQSFNNLIKTNLSTTNISKISTFGINDNTLTWKTFMLMLDPLVLMLLLFISMPLFLSPAFKSMEKHDFSLGMVPLYVSL
jgi:hypothetical protein